MPSVQYSSIKRRRNCEDVPKEGKGLEPLEPLQLELLRLHKATPLTELDLILDITRAIKV